MWVLIKVTWEALALTDATISTPGPPASFVWDGVQPLGFVKLPQVNLRVIKAENYGFKKDIKFYLKPTVKFRKSGSPNFFFIPLETEQFTKSMFITTTTIT